MPDEHGQPYSSRIIKNYTEYLRLNYPQISVDEILHSAEMSPYQVEDPGRVRARLLWERQDPRSEALLRAVDPHRMHVARRRADLPRPRLRGETAAPPRADPPREVHNLVSLAAFNSIFVLP